MDARAITARPSRNLPVPFLSRGQTPARAPGSTMPAEVSANDQEMWRHSATSCAHCGSPVAGVTDPLAAAYCCQGCRVAAAVISACGLGDYHRMRAQLGPVEPVGTSTAPVDDDVAYAASVVARADGS